MSGTREEARPNARAAPPKTRVTEKIVYLRLHGQPKIYYSAYERHALVHYASLLEAAPQRADRWCIFDNTAAGHAVINAWELRELLKQRQLAHHKTN